MSRMQRRHDKEVMRLAIIVAALGIVKAVIELLTAVIRGLAQ